MTQEEDIPKDIGYSLVITLKTPAHISSLLFGHAGHLFAGSDDGSLRVYDLSTFKVLKAVRGLGAEVSSIVCLKRSGSEFRDAWVACGSNVFKFQFDLPKLVQTQDDALNTIRVTENDDDVLNELSLNSSKSHLAFSTDAGVVGVIDLSNNVVTRMKAKHESVCACVKFIPSRARELVSGGFDTELLHFDFIRGEVLTRSKMEPFNVVSGMGLSPPFVMSTAMSSSGILAAGSADGRLWLGFGEERRNILALEGKKKSRKWEGLDEKEALFIRVAEGPIVALAFSDPQNLIMSTLLGVLTHYHLVFDKEKGSMTVKPLWQKQSQFISKVNALLADDKRIIVGGFSSEGDGLVEIWKRETPSLTSENPTL